MKGSSPADGTPSRTSRDWDAGPDTPNRAERRKRQRDIPWLGRVREHRLRAAATAAGIWEMPVRGRGKALSRINKHLGRRLHQAPNARARSACEGRRRPDGPRQSRRTSSSSRDGPDDPSDSDGEHARLAAAGRSRLPKGVVAVIGPAPAVVHVRGREYICRSAELDGSVVTFTGALRRKDLGGEVRYALQTRSHRLRPGEWVQWLGEVEEVAA